jgi:hypothetical protein
VKVYGGLLHRRIDNRHKQVRTIVGARSAVEARRLIEEQTGSHLSQGEFRNYWCTTGNTAELAAAEAAGPGIVLWAREIGGLQPEDFTRWRPARFYVAAHGFGWGVHDRQQGEHPNFARVAYHPMRDHGGDWEAAHQAALADARLRNAEAG